jgi:hypothetical protein
VGAAGLRAKEISARVILEVKFSASPGLVQSEKSLEVVKGAIPA